MAKTKLLAGVLLVLAVLFAQVGSAAAAPLTQDGTITLNGVVTNVGDPFTAENGDTMIPVTIETADGPVTVNLSEATVTALELAEGSEVKDLPVNSGDVVPPDETTEEVHPIAQVLADFFFPDDPTMASTIDSWTMANLRLMRMARPRSLASASLLRHYGCRRASMRMDL